MSDEERAEQGQDSKWRRPRATLESLGDITISGKIAINLRILLEPIGFLRIILIVLTLFAFSLTAGFSNNGSSNQATCQGVNTTTSYTITLTFSYPYRASSFGFIYKPSNASGNDTKCTTVLEMKPFSGSAEFYVFMSSVSFIYGFLALVVYVLFYVPRYDITKYVSILDFVATVVLAFFYILADIAWTAGSYQLKSYLSDLLTDRQNDCLSLMCNSSTVSVNTQSFVQTNFSLLFGWVATIVLIASIWFAYKDTIFHLDRMGPLYKISFFQPKRGQQYRETSPPQREGVASHKEEEYDEEERPRESGGTGWDSARGWDETTPTDEENKW